MNKKIAILKGDGIGPEVVDQAIQVLETIGSKFNHKFEYSFQNIGAIAIVENGTPLPEETIIACQSSDAILLGAIGDPMFDNNPYAQIRPEQGLLRLRKTLELYANIRPVKIYEGLKHLSPLKEERLQDVDLIIYRELTGGIYFGEKIKEDKYSADLCCYEEHEIKRIAEMAFEEAMRRSKKLCLIDKANVLETSRLWRKVVQEMARGYFEVEVDYLFIDNAAMQMILNPGQFDVILTSNMFGDIISDEASVLGGSLGLLPSASYGTQYKLYEPVHGSYPQAKGKDIANPLATILSAAMMLRDFGMPQEALEIEKAINYTIDNNIVTRDLNPESKFGCSDVGNAVSQYINENVNELAISNNSED